MITFTVLPNSTSRSLPVLRLCLHTFTHHISGLFVSSLFYFHPSYRLCYTLSYNLYMYELTYKTHAQCLKLFMWARLTSNWTLTGNECDTAWNSKTNMYYMHWKENIIHYQKTKSKYYTKLKINEIPAKESSQVVSIFALTPPDNQHWANCYLYAPSMLKWYL